MIINVCSRDTHLKHVYFGAKDERSQVALLHKKQEAPYRDRWVSTSLHDLREHYDKYAQCTGEALDLTQGK